MPTDAPLAQGFEPTGKYYLILAGPHKGGVGEAYKFLSWGGISVRVTGCPDLAVYAQDQLYEISYNAFDKLSDL